MNTSAGATAKLVYAKVTVAVLLTVMCGCYEGDGAPMASRTAGDVSLLSLVCIELNKKGFDFNSIESIAQLRDAAVAHEVMHKNELKDDYLLNCTF